MNKQEELLNKLLADGLIDRERLEQANEKATSTSKLITDILIEDSFIDLETLTEEKAKVYGLKYQSLLNKKIEEAAINIIPFEVAENYKIICFEKNKKEIKIGIVDPDNFKAFEAVDFLAKEADLAVEYFLISETSFKNSFGQHRTLSKEISVALKSKEEEEAKEKEVVKEAEKMEEVIESAPVTKIVSVIIRHAVEGGASDIHIEPLQHEARVRYRIDGILRNSLVLPKNIHNAVVARVKVLANLKLDETRIPQDGRIRQIVNNKEVDFRVSVLPLIGEEKVVMRVLDVTRGAPTLEELGFMGSGLEVIKRNIKKTNKMFLVTGPTGSGKSTTLYSVLNMLNKEGINICTLEDPVEYFIEGINQSQIRPEIGFNFASGLRSLLRQDPDVLMVGEIRDNETAELAIHSSLTGHFVLSTMHTNDAFGAIPRLLDMKVEPFLLGSTLNTVVAQRLARKICSHCKAEDKIPADTLEEVKKEVALIPESLLKKFIEKFDKNKLIFYKGAGCPRCAHSGYSGRVALTEVLDINEKIQSKIIDNSKALNVEDIRASQDFISIRQDGLIKVLKGLTTMEELLRVMRD